MTTKRVDFITKSLKLMILILLPSVKKIHHVDRLITNSLQRRKTIRKVRETSINRMTLSLENATNLVHRREQPIVLTSASIVMVLKIRHANIVFSHALLQSVDRVRLIGNDSLELGSLKIENIEMLLERIATRIELLKLPNLLLMELCPTPETSDLFRELHRHR